MIATVIPITRADPAKLPAALLVTELAPTGMRPLVLCRLPHAVLFRPAAGWPARWLRRDADTLDAGVPVDR